MMRLIIFLACCAALTGSASQQIANVDSITGVDPTGATDSTAGIQAAVNSLNGKSGLVQFGTGTYLISRPITNLPYGVILDGKSSFKSSQYNGQNGTILQAANPDVVLFYVTPAKTNWDLSGNVAFRHLAFDGGGTGQSTRNGGHYTNTTHFGTNSAILYDGNASFFGWLTVEDCSVRNFWDGISLRGRLGFGWVNVRHCTLEDNGHFGFFCDTFLMQSAIRDSLIRENRQRTNWIPLVGRNYGDFSAGGGIYIHEVFQVDIQGNDFEGQPHGIVISGSFGQGLNIMCNYFEAHDNCSIYLNNVQSGSITANYCHENYKFNGTWDANANLPPLASGVGTPLDEYVVTVPSLSRSLDGNVGYQHLDRVRFSERWGTPDKSGTWNSTMDRNTIAVLNDCKDVRIRNTSQFTCVVGFGTDLDLDWNLTRGQPDSALSARGFNHDAFYSQDIGSSILTRGKLADAICQRPIYRTLAAMTTNRATLASDKTYSGPFGETNFIQKLTTTSSSGYFEVSSVMPNATAGQYVAGYAWLYLPGSQFTTNYALQFTFNINGVVSEGGSVITGHSSRRSVPLDQWFLLKSVQRLATNVTNYNVAFSIIGGQPNQKIWVYSPGIALFSRDQYPVVPPPAVGPVGAQMYGENYMSSDWCRPKSADGPKIQTTPALWTKVTNNGAVYYMPLYQ